MAVEVPSYYCHSTIFVLYLTHFFMQLGDQALIASIVDIDD
jgi:hypothetical protein